MFITVPLFNDHRRLSWLLAASAEAVRDQAAGNLYLPGPVRNQLVAKATAFQAVVNQHTGLYLARRVAVKDRQDRMLELRVLNRMAFRAVFALAARGRITPEQMDNYKIPTDRRFPRTNSFEKQLRISETLLEGYARAAEQGLPGVLDPTAEELQTALDTARVASEAVVAAKQALKDHILLRKNLIEEINGLWRSAAKHLRLSLEGLTKSEIRDQMRRYGYIFRSSVATDGSGDETTDGESGSSETDGTGNETDTTETTDGTSDAGETEGQTSDAPVG